MRQIKENENKLSQVFQLSTLSKVFDSKQTQFLIVG